MKIELREWTLNDCEALAEVCHNVDRKYLTNGLPYPYTAESGKWWIENCAMANEGTDGIFRAIVVDGKIVGNISVERKEDVFRMDAEIGYLLLDEVRGMGVMTKAVEIITGIAFEKLDILRISARVYSPNIASCRVLEKNGYIREGYMKNAVVKNGNIYDVVMYGKLR